MNRSLYSIFDCKAEAYLPPFLATNDQVATRMVAATANNSASDLHNFAADYTLFRIGIWDESAGLIHMEAANINIGSVQSILNSAQRLHEASTELALG